MANTPEIFSDTPTQATTETHGGAAAHADPSLFGMEPYQIVAIAMLVLIAIAIWKKVPGMITGGLDAKIAAIREQLDEAKNLRAEAEALRDEYSAKIANAEKDAEAMMDNARREAASVLDKAEADSAAMIERRKRMAEDTIAAAEREAIAGVQAKAAMAAAQASRNLIAERHDAAADSKLADSIISSI